MTSSEESERRLAEALRARATGAGHPGAVRARPGIAQAERPEPAGMGIRTALVLALLAGALLGTALALLSLLVPGLLPLLG